MGPLTDTSRKSLGRGNPIILDTLLVCPYYADAMRESSTIVRRVLDQIPMSTRALAEKAGVDEKLLRMIRDGERRLTADVRDSLLAVLRRWRGQLDGALEELEAAEVERQGGGNDR